MRQTLQSRLHALEAIPRPPQPAPMTDEKLRQWCYSAFRFNELHIFDGVVKVNRWTAREHEYEALEGMANAINRWRADTGNHPFLPIAEDDAKEALDLLRAGHLKVQIGPYQIIAEDYKWSWENKVDNHRICAVLDRALRVYLASGGSDGQPYRPGEIEELLTGFIAEVNE